MTEADDAPPIETHPRVYYLSAPELDGSIQFKMIDVVYDPEEAFARAQFHASKLNKLVEVWSYERIDVSPRTARCEGQRFPAGP